MKKLTTLKFVTVCILGGAVEMIATTGTATVHHHGSSLSYSMLGCVVLLIGTFLSVSLCHLTIYTLLCIKFHQVYLHKIHKGLQTAK